MWCAFSWWDSPRGCELDFFLVLCFISFIWTVCYWCALSSHFISVPVCVVSLCRALQPQWSLPPLSVLSECVCLSSVCGRCCAKPLLWVMKVCAIYSGQGGRAWRWDVLYRHDCKDDLWRSLMYNKNAKKLYNFVCITDWIISFFHRLILPEQWGSWYDYDLYAHLLSVAVGVNFFINYSY